MPKLSDPPPTVDPSSHAPTVMDAFVNAVRRMRAAVAAHPDWSSEQLKAYIDSFPDTRNPPSLVADDMVEQARSAGQTSLNRWPEGEGPCCPREAVGGSFNAPPCDCQRLYQ